LLVVICAYTDIDSCMAVATSPPATCTSSISVKDSAYKQWPNSWRVNVPMMQIHALQGCVSSVWL